MDSQLVKNINEQKRIPIEIIHIILVYLRNPQDKNLLEDISNFSRTMKTITDLHYDKWITKLKYNPGIDTMWIENNLLLYANNNYPTRLEIQPKFKDILDRCFVIKNKNKTKTNNNKNYNDYFNINYQKYIYSNKIILKTRINILWGLFTIKERYEFIANCIIENS